MIVNTRYGKTETTTGEILDLSRLSYPPTRTKYNRPVRRYQPRRRLRPIDDLVLSLCGFLVAVAFFLATAVWPA